MSGTDYTRDDFAETAAALRRLLDAVDRGDLVGTAPMRHRLEGSIVTLEALATGRMPSAEDLSGDGAPNE